MTHGSAQRWGLSGCDHGGGEENSVGTKRAEGEWGKGVPTGAREMRPGRNKNEDTPWVGGST